MHTFPQSYDPHEAEKRLHKAWEEKGVYVFNKKSKKPIFSIDTPPPTVSGKMHVGHAFSYSQEDFIVRFKRMRGNEVFFPFGTDDNGLATERLIDRMKGIRSAEMDRKKYVKICLDTLNEIRPDFVSDWKMLGISCDYTLFYSTINEHCQRISQKSFIELYKKGFEYRTYAPIIFCPHCRTAIAQVELEDKEEKSTLNYIKAKMDNNFILYATTRPELLYGCIGMSINKDGTYVKAKTQKKEVWIISKDAVAKVNKWVPLTVIEEFPGKKLLGNKVEIPISKNIVEISHDDLTETQYGTGIVYYCTYGGVDCIEWLTRHPNVSPINIMGLDGKYNEKCGKYKGLDSLQARKEILTDLEKEGFLVRAEPMKHIVNVHERCETDIEYVATEQWFIKYLDKKDMLQKAADKLRWHPQHMKNRYDNWIKGLKWDWCISRQRHFGIPIPVWYCKKCSKVLLPEEKQLPVDPLTDKPPHPCSCGSKDFVPEKDVLDTWATSSLTPQIAVSLVPEQYDQLYPMSFRQNSHDIITFWLFNTIVKSQMHNKVNPWKEVMITGWVLDPHGKKMSKSKGNVIDPRDMWNKYSVDALRFAAAGTKLGDDYPFQEKDVVTGQKTVTKLWNAVKFSGPYIQPDYIRPKKLEAFDLWVLFHLQELVQQCTENFECYEYSRAKADTEKFFWNTFCDQYLEIVKDRLYNSSSRGEDARKSAEYTLSVCIETILKLFAPFMPYITEELYQLAFVENGYQSIHSTSWPEYDRSLIKKDVAECGDRIVKIISDVRKAKSEKNVSLKEPVKKLVIPITEQDIKAFVPDLIAVCRAETVEFGKTFSITI